MVQDPSKSTSLPPWILRYQIYSNKGSVPIGTYLPTSQVFQRCIFQIFQLLVLLVQDLWGSTYLPPWILRHETYDRPSSRDFWVYLPTSQDFYKHISPIFGSLVFRTHQGLPPWILRYQIYSNHGSVPIAAYLPTSQEFQRFIFQIFQLLILRVQDLLGSTSLPPLI